MRVSLQTGEEITLTSLHNRTQEDTRSHAYIAFTCAHFTWQRCRFNPSLARGISFRDASSFVCLFVSVRGRIRRIQRGAWSIERRVIKTFYGASSGNKQRRVVIATQSAAHRAKPNNKKTPSPTPPLYQKARTKRTNPSALVSFVLQKSAPPPLQPCLNLALCPASFTADSLDF